MRSRAEAYSGPAGRDSRGIPRYVGEAQLSLLSRIRLWFDSYFHPALAAGTRAELHFGALAEQKRWVLERVDQSRGGLAKYRAVAGRSVKRGDYICRNCNNAEIELKCKTLYHNDNCFYIEYREIKRLQEMQRITGSRVVFALMERDGSGVRHGSLRMFLLDFLMGTFDYQAGRLYNKRMKCVRVPLKYTLPGFEVLRKLGGTGDA
jgi:hypothetical protein